MRTDPTDIRDEQRRLEEEASKASRAVKGEEADLAWLMSSPRGRRVFWRLLKRTNVFGSSMTGNSQTFYNEGRRSVGIELNDIVQDRCPDSFVAMLGEQKDYDK